MKGCQKRRDQIKGKKEDRRRLSYGYLRTSGPSQTGNDKDSLPRQKEKILAWAKSHRYEVVRFYADEAVSGTKETESRAGFRKMVRDLLANGVRTILVEDYTRLARNLRVFLNSLKDMNDEGIALIDVALDMDVTDAMTGEDPEKQLGVTLRGGLAEWEKSRTVLRLRHGRERVKRERGKCEGNKAYGENSNVLELHERAMKERELIYYIQKLRGHERRGFKRSRYAMSLSKIADKLNDEGRLTRTGREWTVQNLYKVLHPGRGRQAKA